MSAQSEIDDVMLYEQIAQFAMSYPEAYEGFEEGQAAWAAEIIDQAKLFCIHYKNTDWGIKDWYFTSDDWMDAYISECKACTF